MTPLFITSRSRCVPASGAKVRPPLRIVSSPAARPTENASTRRLGSESFIWLSASIGAKRSNDSVIPLQSQVASESRPTSSQPVLSSSVLTCSQTEAAERSRTGRSIIPAWQKRQPRVQPLKTCTATRSWTMPVFGTIIEVWKKFSSRFSIILRRTGLPSKHCGT